MGWRDRLRSASFRGVPFGVRDTEQQSGRRAVVHEFPQRDMPYIEDLGRRARVYQLEAFVVGDDYMDRRDALLTALEAKGPGVLSHPYKGEFLVQVDSYSLRESPEDGRMAVFSIAFLEAGALPKPEVAADRSEQVIQAADVVVTASQSAADQVIDCSLGQTATYTAETASGASAVIDKELKATVASTTDKLDQHTRDLARVAAEMDSLIRQPAELVYRYIGIIERLAIVGEPFSAMRAYSRLYGQIRSYFDGRTYGGTAAGQQAKANADALEQSLAMAIAEAYARAAMAADFTARSQAIEARDAAAEMLEDVLLETGDDEVYTAILDLKTAVLQAIPEEGAQLRDEMQWPVMEAIPSLVLAYQIYGGIDYEQEILDRNGIGNPFAVPGGEVLSVLV